MRGAGPPGAADSSYSSLVIGQILASVTSTVVQCLLFVAEVIA